MISKELNRDASIGLTHQRNSVQEEERVWLILDFNNVWIVLPDFTLYVGFLCGKCPDEEQVDLTLRQCKKCTVADAIIVALIGKIWRERERERDEIMIY